VQPSPSSNLDSDELFHLAVLDSQAARHDEAIRKLKEAIAYSPNHAKANYLLGAEYAEIGLYDRAIEMIERAVHLDPSLITAHFQLGLVHYTLGNVAAAQESWAMLDSTPGADDLIAFKRALLQIAAGEYHQAISELDRGIGYAQANLALLHDMQRVKANVERHLATLPGHSEASHQDIRNSANHLLLSNYQQAPEKAD